MERHQFISCLKLFYFIERIFYYNITFLIKKWIRFIDYFQGKVVWITGASSGIGEFLAVELVKNGASVVISARSLANLERVKGKCLGNKIVSNVYHI